MQMLGCQELMGASVAGECVGRRVGDEVVEGGPSHGTVQADQRGSVLPLGSEGAPPRQEKQPPGRERAMLAQIL